MERFIWSNYSKLLFPTKYNWYYKWWYDFIWLVGGFDRDADIGRLGNCLGRMLFNGQEQEKKVDSCSGEKNIEWCYQNYVRTRKFPFIRWAYKPPWPWSYYCFRRGVTSICWFQLFVYLMIESCLMLMQIELLKFKMMELLLTLKEVMKSLWSLKSA